MTSIPPRDKQCVFTILVQGQRADGEPFWAYLEMSATKAKAFRKAQRRGAFNLDDFGEIVEWGLGTDVPPDVKTRMEREHGVNHQFEEEARHVLQSHPKKSLRRQGNPPASG